MVNTRHVTTQRESFRGARARLWSETSAFAVPSAATVTAHALASKAMAGIDGYGKDSRTVRPLSPPGGSPG